MGKKNKCLLVGILTTLLLSCTFFQTETEKERQMKMEQSINFKGNKFLNEEKTIVMADWGVFKAIFKMFFSEKTVPGKDFIKPGKNIKKPVFKGDAFKVSWLGHSTLLLNIEGKNFLTDPVWAKRVSPVSFLGPERFYEIPYEPSELPEISGVIISHDHYDHLDEYTIKKLSKLNIPHYYVPLGVGDTLVKWGIKKEKIREFDWWDKVVIDGKYTLIATPARHFSGRNIFKRNDTLWSSWVIKTDKINIFFSGDGGYSKYFKSIGDKYGPFDITFIEAGAYDKLWSQIHLGPENVIKAFRDLKGKTLFPIHWGTFKLANHPWDDPAKKLIELGGGKINLMMPKPFDIVKLNNKNLISYWWNRYENQNDKKNIAALEQDGFGM